MGQAKERKAEIEALKRQSPEQTAEWKQYQSDKRLLRPGINPESQSPDETAAMARVLSRMFAEAKQTGNVSPAIEYFHDTINSTVRGLSDIPIACKKGCSHCCHIWVSVAPPEALHIAKIIQQTGPEIVEKVRSAYEYTRQFSFDDRPEHPYPCPLLADDLCSIYDSRPKACRLASSADAAVCARTYHNKTSEDVPTPEMYMIGRAYYAMALASGLRQIGLPYRAYEFNGALVRVLDTPDAERRWLSGENIFDGVQPDPDDTFNVPAAQQLYSIAFEKT